LLAARKKPYFARIDFKEDGAKEKEVLYIGKMCLIRDEDMKPVIIDWRAPVASLYYEERWVRLIICVPRVMSLESSCWKRQFSIENGRLQDVFDIDITTNDEFLQSYLGANADNASRTLFQPIQAEQNRIIRSDMWTPLIVKGAAGSGKTTIALHRIAYLVYTHEKSFNPRAS
jgi:DNA helicase-2/ATP-dependent DNA helicase PcrA